MLKPGKTYAEVYNSFQWEIPEFYNIGVDICDKWADERYRLALIYEDEVGRIEKYTFWDLKRISNRLANTLKFYGIERGDRVGIVLSQCPEAAISHIAAFKLGAISLPLFTQFGPEALEYRLTNSQAKAVITDGDNIERILSIRDKLPHLKILMVTKGKPEKDVLDFWDSLAKGSPYFEPVATRKDDPAIIIYTSGTTGPPKGALHAHRVLLGHLPGIEFAQNFFPKKDDIQWTPVDWAWIAGLMDILLPSLHHGVPVVAYRMRKFDPEQAFNFISKHGIRNSFMTPTILRMMRQVKEPKERYDYKMRAIMCAAEHLGKELFDWGEEVLGAAINEIYGQTEVHVVIGNCSEIMEVRPASMGRAIPGHTVEILDESGNIVPPGGMGEVAVRRPDPVMFLGYWENQKGTEEKFIGDWCLTGDMAKKDEEGYFYFNSRKDDVIKSSGYRIGPSEIEECLMRHPAVATAGVIGSPDEIRGVIVKAFIVLKPEISPDSSLKEDIQNFVKGRLATYEYPREIEFIKELPVTTTGKVMRGELRKMELEKKKMS